MTRHTFAIACALLMTLVIADAAQAVYHPTLGRFAQRDPGVGPTANNSFAKRHSPAQYTDGLNLYQYVRSSPRMLSDPLGLAVAEEGSFDSVSVNFQFGEGCANGNDLKAGKAVSAAVNGNGECAKWFKEKANEHGGHRVGDGPGASDRHLNMLFRLRYRSGWHPMCLAMGGRGGWTAKIPGRPRYISICCSTCDAPPAYLASILLHEVAHHVCPAVFGRETCAVEGQDVCSEELRNNL